MTGDYEVYVLLTDTGTLFSRTIRFFTRDALNHVSIAFDKELNDVYSFGRKSQSNPFFAGFVKEDLRGVLFQHTMCSLYKCTVSPAAYKDIRNRIKQMEQNSDLYKYNLLGMMCVAFKIQLERERAYFCSQFVASIFKENGVNIFDKPPLFVKPGDFQHTTKLELLYHGKLRTYMGIDKSLLKTAAESSFQTA